GQLAVRLGHVGCTALVTAGDELQLILHPAESIQHGQVALARHAERKFRTVNDELVYKNLPARTCAQPLRGHVAMTGVVPVQITPSRRNAAISWSVSFNQPCSTSSVCSPRVGGPLRYSTGVADSRIGFATEDATPKRCGRSRRRPRASTCGSANT